MLLALCSFDRSLRQRIYVASFATVVSARHAKRFFFQVKVSRE